MDEHSVSEPKYEELRYKCEIAIVNFVATINQFSLVKLILVFFELNPSRPSLRSTYTIYSYLL